MANSREDIPTELEGCHGPIMPCWGDVVYHVSHPEDPDAVTLVCADHLGWAVFRAVHEVPDYEAVYVRYVGPRAVPYGKQE